MRNADKYIQAVKLLQEVSNDWADEQVKDYRLKDSFDAIVFSLLDGIDWNNEAETLEAIVAELVLRGAPATYEYPGFINVGGWSFGIEDGELVGNDDSDAPKGAEMDSVIPSADAIETFLRGIAHMGRLPWDPSPVTPPPAAFDLAKACLKLVETISRIDTSSPVLDVETALGMIVGEAQYIAAALKTPAASITPLGAGKELLERIAMMHTDGEDLANGSQFFMTNDDLSMVFGEIVAEARRAAGVKPADLKDGI